MKLVNFRNKKIFYRVEGNGEPVMLLHGFAENGNLWNYQVEKLKNNFQLIVPDLPGSGLSEMIEGEISISDYVEVIKSIVDIEIKKEAKTFALSQKATKTFRKPWGYPLPTEFLNRVAMIFW